MIRGLLWGGMVIVLCSTAFAMTVVQGRIEKIDRTAKTIVVEAADGTEHTFHFVAQTAVHGTEKAGAAANDAFQGLKEGSEVAVHYSVKGSEETAEEVDHLGQGGMQAAKGTVTNLDEGAKTVTIRTVNGTQETFRMTGHAATEAGKDIAEGTGKTANVTVYYTSQAGHKVAHFFTKTF
jgi:hypothetical protein